jgi:hypothetical protein
MAVSRPYKGGFNFVYACKIVQEEADEAIWQHCDGDVEIDRCQQQRLYRLHRLHNILQFRQFVLTMAVSFSWAF